jgi:hypothetical protein
MVGYVGTSDIHPLGRLLLERISMQDIGYELPRRSHPGTWVNKLRRSSGIHCPQLSCSSSQQPAKGRSVDERWPRDM